MQNHRQRVHLQVVHNLTWKSSFLTVVYASCNVVKHLVMCGKERIGGNAPDTLSMADFNQCLLDCNLLDVGFVGSKYTWSNGTVSQRLDRVVCNQSCIDQ
ncbi:hypothetical protein LIER_37660 [Lithospermum erythrorhizon]|uniref:Uncharacterized protein n=1 Tax=Lithospermum erythrorhizon TaxID=34254 RepID=A0AAV3PQY8_LITER